MPAKLTFLHTSPVHVATFDGLLEQRNIDLIVEHIIDEELLAQAREEGISLAVQDNVQAHIDRAAKAGADLILCTCSTIGGCAEATEHSSQIQVMRVDRAMAGQAVAVGKRIIVAATLQSTIAPTRLLIEDSAHQAGKEVFISEVVFEDAWTHFEAGDQAGYVDAIVDGLASCFTAGDVIVLAQASMSAAAKHYPSPPIPILSSPALGLDAALGCLSRANKKA